MTAADPYKVLGVAKNATEDDIKKAYRTLAKQYHPDKNKDDGAEEKFKEIGAAYETLKDPVKKWDFDNKREGDEEKARKSKPSSSSTTFSSKPSSFKTHTGGNGTSFSFNSGGTNFTFKSTFNSFDNDRASDEKKKDKGGKSGKNNKKKSGPQSFSEQHRRTFDFTRPSWNSHFAEDSDGEEQTMPNMFRFSFGNFQDPFDDMDDIFSSFFKGSFFSGTHRDFLRINVGAGRPKPKKVNAMEDMWDWSNPLFNHKTPRDTLFDEEDEFGYSSDPEVEDLPNCSVPCSYCGRTFKAHYVKKHEEVCRKIFSGSKQHQQEIPKSKPKKNKPTNDEETRRSPSPPPRSHDWRREHEELQRNVRNARNARAHKTATTSARGAHTPTSDDASMFIKCQWCGRKFSPIVAERHIPQCADRTRTFGEPMNPAGASTARDSGSKNQRSKEYAKNIPKPKVSNDTPFKAPRDYDEPFSTSGTGLHSSTPRASNYTRPSMRTSTNASTRPSAHRNVGSAKSSAGVSGSGYRSTASPLRTGRRM